MKVGDLVHIPQAVFLWSEGFKYNFRTEKPLIGLFVGEVTPPFGSKEKNQWVRVFARGGQWAVYSEHIYVS
tara:strand:+ start:156 stop:368 length:213 start_codon:yes stop_codon:yes gene_type:complete